MIRIENDIIFENHVRIWYWDSKKSLSDQAIISVWPVILQHSAFCHPQDSRRGCTVSSLHSYCR